MLNKLKKLSPNERHKKEIIINIEQLETRVAILENGKLDNFHIESKIFVISLVQHNRFK